MNNPRYVRSKITGHIYRVAGGFHSEYDDVYKYLVYGMPVSKSTEPLNQTATLLAENLEEIND